MLAAGLGAQRGEVGMSVRAEHHRLAVDQGVVDGQGAHRLGDPRNRSVKSAPYRLHKLDALALLAGEDPVSVVLDLVQPARPGGRMGDEGRLTRLDEAGRRGAPGTRRRDTPQHARDVGDRAPAGQIRGRSEHQRCWQK